MSNPVADLFEDDPQVTFLQHADKQLYGDRQLICFGNTLYQWTGTHYQELPDEAEFPRVRKYCNTYKVIKTDQAGNQTVTYPHAKPKCIKEVLDWVKLSCTLTADQVNPPGINCTNGVLLLHWEGKKLITELVPHSPDRYFLTDPKVKYDPKADPTEYERLMECLDFASREIWERTISSALDLPTVRKHRGRAVRALLLKGDGSNGKDTLRTLVQTVLGSGAFSSCSVTDFQEYDRGRAFPVYPLRGKLINWPSENADVGRIDQLRGLRAAITGDPISWEAKYQMPVQEPPRAVFIFNLNESPTLVASMKATASRWGIVPFDKTYSDNPGPGELQADPRFKEDPQFLAEQIAPAFLNRLLIKLQAVIDEGIDFTPTQDALEEIQRESSHLMQFAADTGLHYDPQGSVTVKDVWTRLETWYQDNGTLTIETGPKGGKKLIWTDQVKRSDRNVKSLNQVIPRFLEVFPKARKGRRLTENRNYEAVITGIKFSEIGYDAHDAHEEILESRSQQALQPEPLSPPLGTNWVRSPHETSGTGYENQSQFEPDRDTEPPCDPESEFESRTRSCPDRAQIVPSEISETQSQPADRTHRTHRTQFQENFSGWGPKAGDRVRYQGRDSLLRRVVKQKVLTLESPGPDPAYWLVNVPGGVSQTVPLADLVLVGGGA